jgi:flagellar protein FliO/FliZ
VDTLSWLRAVGALAFTLALLFGFAILLRRYGHKLGALGMAVPGSKTKRLSVSELLPIDARHRLVMIRRDATEHLVILGPTGTTVVETNIAVPEVKS